MRERLGAELPYVAGLLLGLAILVGGGYPQFRETRVGWNEFSYFWSGSRTIIDGGDPYRSADWLATLARYGTAPGPEPFFFYPPWNAVALLPLGALPLRVAAEIWTVGGIVLAVLALRSLLRTAAPGDRATHTLAGLALLGSQPAIASYWSGQWSFVLVAALAAATTSALRGGLGGSSAALVLLAKPHLFPFALWGLLAAHVARGRRAIAGAVAAAAVLLVGVALFAAPLWRAAWLGAFDGPRYEAAHTPTTLAHALADVIGAAGPPLAAGIVLAAVIVALRFDPRGDAWLAVWPTLSLVAAVFVWSYDHLVLVVPLVVAAGVAGRRSRRRGTIVGTGGLGAFVLGPTILYAVATARDSESFHAVVPLAALAFVVGVLWDERHRATGPTEAAA